MNKNLYLLCNYMTFSQTIFCILGVPCSMSCKNCNGVSCYNRQVPDKDNDVEDEATSE